MALIQYSNGMVNFGPDVLDYSNSNQVPLTPLTSILPYTVLKPSITFHKFETKYRS